MDQTQIPRLLIDWYRRNARDLPWRKDRNPYHIWLSEIMLQQTRVEAVKGYYARFLSALPTIEALSNADGESVNKLWEGLGYYSRARNLHRAAQVMTKDYGGRFPESYDEIRALPGIGDYTAGAIASIAFGQPRAAVDGNVLRVWARLFAMEDCVDEAHVKKTVRQELEAIYPEGECGDFTQSLMELGATVCLPNGEPHCDRCPLSGLCKSKADELWRTLPRRAEKKTRRVEEKTIFLLHCGDKTAILKRPAKGLLAGLWQFPEASGKMDTKQAMAVLDEWNVHPVRLLQSSEKEHIFTHVEWKMTGYYVICGEMPKIFDWVTDEALTQTYSVPTAYRQFYDPTIFKEE